VLRYLLYKKKVPVNTADTIHVGVRNAGLFNIGCSLRGKGKSSRDIGIELHRINAYQCEVPLEDSEVNQIIDSVNQYIARDKKPLFKYRDFVRSNEFPKDPALRHIAHAICLYMDLDGKSAYPTEEQIANDTGYSRRYVIKKIATMRKEGLLLVKKHKQKDQLYHNNVYFLPRRFVTT